MHSFDASKIIFDVELSLIVAYNAHFSEAHLKTVCYYSLENGKFGHNCKLEAK